MVVVKAKHAIHATPIPFEWVQRREAFQQRSNNVRQGLSVGSGSVGIDGQPVLGRCATLQLHVAMLLHCPPVGAAKNQLRTQ